MIKKNKKLRIAFVCNVFPGLAETFIRNQIDYFLKKNHRVDIYAASYIIKNDLLKKYKNVYGSSGKFIKFLLFPFYFFKYFFKKPKEILDSLNFLKWSKEAVSLKIFYTYIFFLEKNYDILMCHFGSSGNVSSFIKKNLLQKVKLFCMFHGREIRETEKKNKMLYKPLYDEGDIILSISEYNKKYLNKWFNGSKAKIINHPVGIDTLKFKTKKEFNKSKIDILSVGRLIEEKGYFYALNGIKKLLGEFPDKKITYRIIGGGYLKKKLKEYVRKNSLNQNVKILGPKSSNEVRTLLKKSDIFLSSSISEALPVSIMEAQSSGLPIIATDVGGVKELIINQKNGFIVSPLNSEEIYKKLSWMINNKNKWKKLGKVGRRNVEKKYDINILNKKLEKLFYNSLKKVKNANL